MGLSPRIEAIEDKVQGLDTLTEQVEAQYIDVPHTTITNRAQILDPANDLRPRLGVERVRIDRVEPIDGEVGPSGEQIYKPENDLLDRVRFVGNWINNKGTNDSGGEVRTKDDDSYIEYTFFGTGFNLLWFQDTTDRSVEYSIDGGSFTPLTLIGDDVLEAGNYAANQVFNIASGLSQDTHTITVKSTTNNTTFGWGFEILNETTQITTNPGAMLKSGERRELASQDTQDYATGFESEQGTSGTRGGHVAIYQKADGSIAKSIQWTNASQLDMDNADHSNEELIRKYHWQEFGRGRANDWNSADDVDGDYAFTLDDGVTTLVGNNVRINNAGKINLSAAGRFITLTFVGTGLDIKVDPGGTAAAELYDVTVNGNLIANDTNFNGPENETVLKIVSGLPYGTHTCKIETTNDSGATLNPFEFLVYGPKKPTLPADAVELGDYFLMADYSQLATDTDTWSMSNGVLRKQIVRENIYYEGNFNQFVVSTTDFSGFVLRDTDGGAAAQEFTFWGTGFDFRWDSGTNRAVDCQFTLDDGSGAVNMTAANFPSATFNLVTTGTGMSFNDSTGILDMANDSGNQYPSFAVTGLPLGLYTVKIRVPVTSASNRFIAGTFDIITPIHTPSFDTEISKQQIVGSSGGGIKDLRNWKDKPTLKTRAQQIEDGEVEFDHFFSGAKISSDATATVVITISKCIPYKTSNGTWRIRFNCRLTHGADSGLNVFFAGVIFTKDFAVAARGTPHTSAGGLAVEADDRVLLNYGAGTVTATAISGDVELTGKPTWAV